MKIFYPFFICLNSRDSRAKVIISSMTNEFIESIKQHQSTFGLNLADEKISALAEYYQFVQEHNEILHLVAPCVAEEFATRHILESLTLSAYLPKNAKFADIGTGAGLPSVPCLIAREDLHAVLIESKAKKVSFRRSSKTSSSAKKKVSRFS